MNKLLLATTALVTFAAGSAFANAPTAELGGLVSSQIGFTDMASAYEKNDANGDRDYRNATLNNKSEVFVKVNGKADNGLVYGAEAGLQTKASAKNNHRTFVFMESGFGRVELGSNDAADDAMKVDASTIARATGGINGDWDKYISTVNYNNSNDLDDANTYGFITSPDLYIYHDVITSTSAEDIRKVTYYSPRISGFQLGLSYAADSNNKGDTTDPKQTKLDSGQIQSIYFYGLNYAGQFEGIDVNASITGEHGESEVSTKKDLKAYAAGLSLSMDGFTVAGSYGDWGKSLMATNTSGLKGAKYYTAGMAYVQGPLGVSLTYLDSKRNDNSFKNISVGADYMLAPGLLPYIEYSSFRYKPAAAVSSSDYPKNSGSVFIAGTKLSF